MSDFDNVSAAIRDQFTNLSALDITHDELGISQGFHEANQAKSEICIYVETLMDQLDQNFESINQTIVEASLEHIGRALDEVYSISKNINDIATRGVNEPSFPKQRTNLTGKISLQKSELFKNLNQLELNLALDRIDGLVSSKDFFITAQEDAVEQLSQLKGFASQAQTALEALQSKASQTGVEKSASSFDDQYKHHRLYELFWGLVFFIASIVFVNAVLDALSFEISEVIGIAELLEFLKRLIMVTIPSVFMKLSLTKYNTERNLRIIYNHRQQVLAQYKSFEAGIGNDIASKNQFRLEIAKYIFSDPSSGYVSDANHSATEVNINPLVSVAEKIAKSR